MTGPVLSLQLSTIHEANDRLRPNAIEVIEPLPFSFVYCLFFFGGCSLFRWGGLERRGEKKKEEKKKLGIAGDVARQLSDCGFISARDSTLTEDHPLSPPSLCRLLFFRCHKTSAKIQSRTVVVKKKTVFALAPSVT